MVDKGGQIGLFHEEVIESLDSSGVFTDADYPRQELSLLMDEQQRLGQRILELERQIV